MDDNLTKVAVMSTSRLKNHRSRSVDSNRSERSSRPIRAAHPTHFPRTTRDSHTFPRTARISLIVSSVVATFAAVLCIANLMVAYEYNLATNQLHTAISQYTKNDPDLDFLEASQAHTDAQFDIINSLTWMQWPSLATQVSDNTRISHALSEQIRKDIADRDNAQSQSSNSSNSSSSDASNSSHSSNTSNQSNSSHSKESQSLNETDKARLQTLLSRNTVNTPTHSVPTDSSSNSTPKPW